LTTTGKSKGKKKFRSAEEAKRYRENVKEWQDLKDKWNVSDTKKSKPVMVELPTTAKPYIRDTGPRPASKSSWHTGAVTSKQSQQYTGTAIVGISTLHKSNAVPVFSQKEAEEIAKMRR
jgi:viroplasmin and RNaseH domain-containing protein